MKRFKIKYLKTLDTFVLHVRKPINGRNKWRRLWGYAFATESVARKFAEGTF